MPDLFRHPTSFKLYRRREREPCVYMMSSGDLGTIYTGVTSILVGRVQQHRDGAFDGFTKRYGCKRLVWYEVTDTMESAIAFEEKLKKWLRDWKCNLTERLNSERNDLAVGLGLRLCRDGVARNDVGCRDKPGMTVRGGCRPFPREP